MIKEPTKTSGKDIFTLISEASKKKIKTDRARILQSMKIKEYFEEGSISIDKKTCKGVECKLCIKACPTNALYWKSSGEVGIAEELCVYCAACVANCIVDDCIQVTRKRLNGRIEKFSSSINAFMLLNKINSEKRIITIKKLFP